MNEGLACGVAQDPTSPVLLSRLFDRLLNLGHLAAQTVELMRHQAETLDSVAHGVAPIAVQAGRDLPEGEPPRLKGTNPRDAGRGICPIEPVVAVCPRDRVQEPEAGVVINRPTARPASPGKLADPIALALLGHASLLAPHMLAQWHSSTGLSMPEHTAIRYGCQFISGRNLV